MSQPRLRERRRKETEGGVDTAQDDVHKSRMAARVRSNTYPLAFVVLVGVIFLLVTKYPEVAKQIIEPWYDFEDSSRAGSPQSQPKVEILVDLPKRDAVVAAFKHAWGAYGEQNKLLSAHDVDDSDSLKKEKHAFGHDEYHPISRQGSNLSDAGGIGYTVVDSIDTMVIMGLHEEELRARKWVETLLDFDRDGNYNTFETTIRVLGGLLSAHYLTSAPIYLKQAVELADRIMPVFDSPSGIPWSMINLGRREGVPDKDNNGLSSTAEAATLQLEFKYLSYLTDDDTYWKAVEKVMAVIKKARVPPGLAPIFMSPHEGKFVTSAIRLGSRGDSYYEYLLKQYLQTSRQEHVYREMYDDAMAAIHKNLLKRSMKDNLLYTSELIPERGPDGALSWRQVPKQDHLVCFIGGSFMLGATDAHANVPPRPRELSEIQLQDWNTGVELIKTCMATHDTKTGLSPEIAHFRLPSDPPSISALASGDWYIKGAQGSVPYDARYILRPETVESLFIAYRLTGDQQYRDWGWGIFSAIEKYCKIEGGGYAAILNVDAVPVQHDDKMETFLMSETLKYLFLLFSDSSILPLDEVVFNTEAHPLPVFEPHIRTGFS